LRQQLEENCDTQQESASELNSILPVSEKGTFGDVNENKSSFQNSTIAEVCAYSSELLVEMISNGYSDKHAVAMTSSLARSVTSTMTSSSTRSVVVDKQRKDRSLLPSEVYISGRLASPAGAANDTSVNDLLHPLRPVSESRLDATTTRGGLTLGRQAWNGTKLINGGGLDAPPLSVREHDEHYPESARNGFMERQEYQLNTTLPTDHASQFKTLQRSQTSASSERDDDAEGRLHWMEQEVDRLFAKIKLVDEENLAMKEELRTKTGRDGNRCLICYLH